MGIQFGKENAVVVVSGSISAAGNTTGTFFYGKGLLSFNPSSLSGATVTLQISFDEGVTWLNMARDASGTLAQWTTFTSSFVVVFEVPERGCQIRLNTAGGAITGSTTFRISQ